MGMGRLTKVDAKITLVNSFARLADVGPVQLILYTEENDWGLVGAELRAAVDAIAAEQADKTTDDRDGELVEA